MVHSNRHNRFLLFLSGQCGMEITVLLLLTVPFAVASPLRLNQRSDGDTVLSGDEVQATRAKRSEVAEEERVPALRVIPYQSDDTHLGLDALKKSMALRSRQRRTPQRGCQLGTCQLHNLANTLFNFSKTNGKDESKKANDPQGYGR